MTLSLNEPASPSATPPGWQWLCDRITQPQRIARFFDKLGADPSIRWYHRAIVELSASLDAADSRACLYHPQMLHLAEFIGELDLSVTSADSMRDTHAKAGQFSPAEGQFKKYPVMGLVIERGHSEGRTVLRLLRLVIVLAQLTALENEVAAVEASALSILSALRQRNDSSPAQRLGAEFIAELAALVASSRTVFDLLRSVRWHQFSSAVEAECTPEIARHRSELLGALRRLETVFLPKPGVVSDSGSVDKTVDEQAFEAPSIADPDDNHFDRPPAIREEDGPERALDWLQDQFLEGDEPEEANYSAIVQTPSGIRAYETTGLPEYQVNRSLGKLLRSHYINSYSKMLFNPIERAFLTAYLSRELKESECPVGPMLLALSISSALPLQGMCALLVIGEGGAISPEGVYKKKVYRPPNGARPGAGEEALFLGTRDEITVQLPEIALALLAQTECLNSEARNLQEHLGMSIEQMRMAMAESMRQLRALHGRRFHLDRVESQLRYFIAEQTKDISLGDTLFGFGPKSIPIQRTYRRLKRKYIREQYRRLAALYFSGREGDRP